MDDALLDDLARRHGLSAAALDELRAALRPDLSLRTPRTPSAQTIDLDGDAEPEPEPDEGPRYRDLGLLGEGGMSEVRRVFDRDLGRVVAMKLLRADLAIHAPARARFLQEARVIARLQHPGVLPIYEIGAAEDERLYFTMPVVEGRTLQALLQDPNEDRPLRRLITILRTVCEAVAFAHANGILHRDLKPSNVMVGEHGRVLVTDWGLATELTRLRARRGRAVVGTPAYMAPEQARGDHDAMGPAADVHALGVMLVEMLTGTPPFEGLSPERVIARVAEGGAHALPDEADGHPAELLALARAALAAEPEARPAHAGVLAEGLTAWLDGARRRDRARQLVSQARATSPEVAGLRDEARALREDAERGLHATLPWAPIEEKLRWWEMQERAEALEGQAASLEGEAERLLHMALNLSPELPDARRLLAEGYRAEHERAEVRGDRAAMLRAEAMLRAHDDGRHAPYLQASGHLSLRTDPPGAEVELLRYEERQRRLFPMHVGNPGRAPLDALELPAGSYLLKLRARGCVEVRYPVKIERQGHWRAAPPGHGGLKPLRLPRIGELPASVVLVPEGWFLSGGDPEAFCSLPARTLWVEGFAMQRHPVTNGAWLAFLNALLGQGREDEALACAPRELGRAYGEEGHLLWPREPDGRFALPEGRGGAPDHPVTMVTAEAATAYARFVREATGQPWRLPGELEWEKAARGVDGRAFPWGAHLDPTWCQMARSQPGSGAVVSVDRYPVDESPYGARGLAGNTRDWCADPWQDSGPTLQGLRVPVPPLDPVPAELRVYRGGYWDGPERDARTASRFRYRPLHRSPSLGLRLVMSWPAPQPPTGPRAGGA